MMAKINYSKNLSRSLSYGRDEQKGGEIILQSGYINDLSPQENADRWERLSNDYRCKAVHYILSFSDKDTVKLRGCPEEQRIKMMQDMLREFISTVGKKGNNISDCPFVCFHHGNTDNEHLHLYVLMTTWEGKRFKTDFIGKNATRAAARVSILWNMEGPMKAVKSEWKHMLKIGAISEDNMPDQLREEYNKRKEKQHNPRHHVWSDDMNVINDRFRRKQAAEEARKRKMKCAFIVSEAAKASKDKEAFIAKLKESGLEFFISPEKGFSVRFTENDKEHTYSFKQLSLDNDIVPYIEATKAEVGSSARKGDKHDRTSAVKFVPGNGKSGGRATRQNVPSGNAGGSSSDNREFEVGGDDGYEQGIKKNGHLTR